MMDECKAEVDTPVDTPGGRHRVRCSRKAVRDGYCKQHHPDAVAARRAASDARYKQQEDNSPWAKLSQAQATIATLTAERDSALEQMDEMREALKEAKSWIKSAVNYYQLDLPESDNNLNVLWRINRALAAPDHSEAMREVRADPELRKVYLTNIVVHHALDSGMSLAQTLVALAEAYDRQDRQLVKLLGTMPVAAGALAKMEAGNE